MRFCISHVSAAAWKCDTFKFGAGIIQMTVVDPKEPCTDGIKIERGILKFNTKPKTKNSYLVCETCGSCTWDHRRSQFCGGCGQPMGM